MGKNDRHFVGEGVTSIGVGDTGHTHDVDEDGFIDCAECAHALRTAAGNVAGEEAPAAPQVVPAPAATVAIDDGELKLTDDEIEEAAKAFADLTVADVLERVGSDPRAASIALQVEKSRGDAARTTLVDALQQIIDTAKA